VDDQQIIAEINQQLGGGGGPGFGIATTELTGYVRHTRDLADDLHRLAKRTINSVQTIAEDSFGKIGKETGFAAALNHFAGALEHQIHGVAGNADKLSDGVAKTARTYREQDEEIAESIMDMLR
jgi:methyl-accepting chemotaxis protein